MVHRNKKNFLLIISGPTGCGKTALSNIIASKMPAQIINADVGQFYTQLSVGTAKPDLKKQIIKHHLFDILDTPSDLSAFEYEKLVDQKIKLISQDKDLPILVGGSLFYIKSLFFSLQKLRSEKKLKDIDFTKIKNEDLWCFLNQIDEKRAAVLHPNDIYRIKRALLIWQKTGIKPSEYEPVFNPKFDFLFVFINLDKKELEEHINQRTVSMIEKEGWIQEAESLYGTEWQDFIIKKGLIGYPEIFDWIRGGKKKQDLENLIKTIQCKTFQYAKKQLKFWKSFRSELERHNGLIIEIYTLDKEACLKIEDKLHELL